MKTAFYLTFSLAALSFLSCETEKKPSIFERLVDVVEKNQELEEEARNKEYSLDEDRVISATDLVYAYDGNELRADESFLDSIFSIEGKIDEIGRDAFEGTPVIDIRGGGIFDIVQCYFEDGSALTRFNIGDKVRITGRCAGKNGFVEMRECTDIVLLR